jgi:DNA-binding cell septation regulator SpoVG
MSDPQIKVEIRPPGKRGAIKAYADVSLLFPDGEVDLIGFAIIKHSGKSLWVGWPQNHGQNKYFPVVEAKGRIRDEINKAILRAHRESQWWSF